MATMSKAEADAFMGEYFAFTEDIRKSGHYVAGEALHPVNTATTIRAAKREAFDHRRALRRDQGTARRLLPDRSARPERRPPGGGEDPLREDGHGRSAAGRGLQPAVGTAPAHVHEPTTESVPQAVERLYRSESRRVLATLIRLLGDFALAEEALHDAFVAAVERWPADGIPEQPRAWLVSTGRFKAIDGLRRRARFDASLGELARRIEAAAQDVRRRRVGRGRSPAPRLHVLPPGAAARCAGGAHAARGVRPDHRGDRARVPRHAEHRGPAHRARQGQDSRREDSLPGAVGRRVARAARRRAPRRLPGVQRGLFGVVGPVR